MHRPNADRNQKSTIGTVLAALLCAALLTGCGAIVSQVPGQGSGEQHDVTETADADDYAWDESTAPDYYLVDGPAQVDDSVASDDGTGEGTVEYGDTDALGRATGVKARLTHDMREEAKERGRQDIPDSVDVAGWGHNGKASITCPDGSTYNGYFWNRSHLLADSLGGDPVSQNLVTGTRMQNVGGNSAGSEVGMAYTESQARAWLDRHDDGSLYYAATPVYAGDELVPRAVLVDVKSTDGSIDEHVVVYNAAKGYSIDYKTGEFSKE